MHDAVRVGSGGRVVKREIDEPELHDVRQLGAKTIDVQGVHGRDLLLLVCYPGPSLDGHIRDEWANVRATVEEAEGGERASGGGGKVGEGGDKAGEEGKVGIEATAEEEGMDLEEG